MRKNMQKTKLPFLFIRHDGAAKACWTHDPQVRRSKQPMAKRESVEAKKNKRFSVSIIWKLLKSNYTD